jgi:hypothetical protein
LNFRILATTAPLCRGVFFRFVRILAGTAPTKETSFRSQKERNMIDIVASVSAKINALGIPLITMARLSRISESELRRIINRQMDCPNEKAFRLDALMKEIEIFVASIAPTPVNWKKAAAVEEALERLRSGDLTCVNASVGENIPRSLRTDEGFFVRREARGTIVYSLVEKDAASTSWTTAREIQKLLAVEGVKSVQIVMSSNRIRSYALKTFWRTEADLPIEESAIEIGPRFD